MLPRRCAGRKQWNTGFLSVPSPLQAILPVRLSRCFYMARAADCAEPRSPSPSGKASPGVLFLLRKDVLSNQTLQSPVPSSGKNSNDFCNAANEYFIMQKSVEVSYNKSTDFANAFPYFPGNTVPVQYTPFSTISSNVYPVISQADVAIAEASPLSMESDCTVMYTQSFSMITNTSS